MSLLEMVLKLGLAVLVGGLVGLERERQDRPAGLRTHLLVCVGSALITLVSMEMAPGRSDPSRIAAQIVTGIGFLGAGTIFRYGSGVRGLTTAAGLWVVAGIGMGIAAGGKLLPLAALTGLLVFAVNWWVRTLEDRMFRVYQAVSLTLADGATGLAPLLEGLDTRGVKIEELRWVRAESPEERPSLWLRLRLPGSGREAGLAAWLAEQPGVHLVEWE
jgi:putative Mg2+ transporter-C (MgtC) family protein